MSPSVSALCENAKKFDPNRFMRRNQKRVLDAMDQAGHGEFCFAVDDTANPKYGKKIFASEGFGSSGGVFTGQKVMVLVVVNLRTGRAVPVSYSFLTGKKILNTFPQISSHLT